MNIVTTAEQLDEVVEHYSALPAFFFDIETMGEFRGKPVLNKLTWISLACNGRVDVIPMGHPNGSYVRTDRPLLKSGQTRLEKGLPLREQDYSKDKSKEIPVFSEPPEQLSVETVMGALKPVLLGSALKVAHNVKFDSESLAKYLGAPVAPPYADTMIAEWCLDSRLTGRLSLDQCLKRTLGYEMTKGIGKMVEAHPFDAVATYAGNDSRWGWRLWRELEQRLISVGVYERFINIEMRLLEAVIAMELNGAPIDVAALDPLYEDVAYQIEVAKAQVWKAAGRVFNINSNKEKQEILFSPKSEGGRGLKGKVLTPKGREKSPENLTKYDYAVSEEALNAFPNDALCKSLRSYEDLNKLMGTYILPYRGGTMTRTTGGKSKEVEIPSVLINGRIHAKFNQIGAETGRFSSSEPNLQQVPSPRTANGKAIRNLFYAPAGYKLLNADYSQIEPRIIAAFSGDPHLIEVYDTGEDIYTTIAERVGTNRDGGKTLVLATAYGVGDKNNAKRLGISEKDAKDLRERFEREFPRINELKRKTIQFARSKSPVPYVETVMGHRRYVPEILSSDEWQRARGERQVFNTLIQGSAADIMKTALIRVNDTLPEGCDLLMTIHDEVLVLAPDHLVEAGSLAIKEGMEGAYKMRVPLVAEVKVVERWGEAK